jgi:precorrin-3B synthase
MADCPGVLHLAAMADGHLARLRVPGGELDARQLRTIARASTELGSGVVDLTNRANLQIRGLAPDAGPALARALVETGLMVGGPADRRRNILLDPLSGLDPTERRDLRALGRALEAALTAAPWIAGLSPKFSFALDGGGRAAIGGAPSDVVLRAVEGGLSIAFSDAEVLAGADDAGLAVALAVARAAAEAGPDVRAAELPPELLTALIANEADDALPHRRDDRSGPVAFFGAAPTQDAGHVAVALPVPVGRLDSPMLEWLAGVADAYGSLALAPWRAVVLRGVPEADVHPLLAASEAVGFGSVAVARRLTVTACAGAPGCVRAREPAKAAGAALLAFAAGSADALPAEPRHVHLSACSKGCAGSALADLLLLGSSDAPGWTVHRRAAPRAPGPAVGATATADPAKLLALIALDR